MGDGFRDLLESLYEEIGEEYEEPPDTDPPSCNCCECITCYNRASDEKKWFEKQLQVWCKKGGRRKQLRKVLNENENLKDIAEYVVYVLYTCTHTQYLICYVTGLHIYFASNYKRNEWYIEYRQWPPKCLKVYCMYSAS